MSVRVKLVMVVSLAGMTYTDANATGSFVSESSTVALMSLIRPWKMLSFKMNTCARAPRHTKRHKNSVEITFFIAADFAAIIEPKALP